MNGPHEVLQMRKNKDMKKRAKKSFKANYFSIIAVCFVMAFFGITTSLSTIATDLPSAISGSTESAEASYESGDVKVINQDSPQHQWGMTDYLTAMAKGDKDTKQIANSILESFKGTGGVLYGVLQKVDTFVFSHNSIAKLIAIIAILCYLFYYIFVKSALEVGFMRYILETRTYSKTSIGRVFMTFRRGGFIRTGFNMALRGLFISAVILIPSIITGIGINLTIGTDSAIPVLIAAVIVVASVVVIFFCYYGIFAVPYILAENPNMKFREVLQLSWRMMKGHRWQLFRMQLSFIGWILLSAITFGLLSIFFLSGYLELTFAEFYLDLREKAVEDNLQYSYNLKDEFLTNPPEKWLSENNLVVSADQVTYAAKYPDMKPAKDSKINKLIENMNPTRHYSFLTFVLFFFIFCFIGWCWEVSLHLVGDGVFVNRGTLHGPWLPIYGAGGVAIILLLKRFAKKPPLLFILTMLLCCVMEYASSWYLETTKGLKYWDYSNYLLNVNGRICLEGALVFAFAGLIFVYAAGPFLDNLLAKAKTKPKTIVAIVLTVFFIADVIYSHYVPNQGAGITDYDKKDTSQCVQFLTGDTENINVETGCRYNS